MSLRVTGLALVVVSLVPSGRPVSADGSRQAPARAARPPVALVRAEPAWPTGAPAVEGVVVVQVTIDPSGAVSDARLLSGRALWGPMRTGVDLPGPVLTAARAWRFEPQGGEPVTALIGMNVTRSGPSGPAQQAVRPGKPPKKLLAFMAICGTDRPDANRPPALLDLIVDAAGVPIAAVTDGTDTCTLAAIDTALQWRFEPQRNVPRRQVEVSVDFTAPAAFGPPRSEWPAGLSGWPTPPRKIFDARPLYPPEAQKKRIQGTVFIEALLGVDGTIKAGRVTKSVPLLDQAALDAVRQWRFTPALVGGEPRPTVMTVTVSFNLGDRSRF